VPHGKNKAVKKNAVNSVFLDTHKKKVTVVKLKIIPKPNLPLLPCFFIFSLGSIFLIALKSVLKKVPMNV